MRALIEDGPHQGIVEVSPDIGSTLKLADTGTTALRPFTIQRYTRVLTHPDDFLELAVEARFRWDP